MTNPTVTRAVVVLLDEPVRFDDFDEGVGLAIRMIRGVSAVVPVEHGFDPEAEGRRLDARHSAIRWHQDQLTRLFDDR